MATLVFSTAGGALGGAIGGTFGGAIGYTLGALGGQLIDRRLFSPSERDSNVSPPSDVQLQSSTYGTTMARVFGTARVSGEVVWASRFRKQPGARRGKGGNSNGDEHYTISVAIALGEGVVDGIRRIWFDGELVNPNSVTMRFYKGDEEQEPDPLIAFYEEDAPAYRGCAYVVFDRLDVTPYGNRLPQMNFEITRGTQNTYERIKAVSLIPGATEWGYSPDVIVRHLNRAHDLAYENRNSDSTSSDVKIAIQQLKQECPNCTKISLVVAWFATSLDANTCEIKPKVANRETVENFLWEVNGLGNGEVELLTRVNNQPAYDGTPADISIIRIIRYLKEQGFKVMFHPFIMVDAEGYPWRGRIGKGQTFENYNKANQASDRFFGKGIEPEQFNVAAQNASTVTWNNPQTNDSFNDENFNQWGFFRMLYHYAHLCSIAGGVEEFLLGSELGGITKIKAGVVYHPSVAHLKQAAQNIKAILPDTKLSYGANWDEYGGYGRGEERTHYHHLDPLWIDPNVDFVGINYYMPLADWRDEHGHLDSIDNPSVYDLDYLRRNIHSGEGLDWYYRSFEERSEQIRTPIGSGISSQFWIWRWKDLKSWWENNHFDVNRGAFIFSRKRWQAGLKPIYLTEAGCPAVDKGANQPNVFSDFGPGGSSESGFPYFSHGERDDYMQNSFIEALLSAFDPDDPEHLDDFNPVLNGIRMLNSENIFLWCWDARPYPWFPRLSLWKDGVNWARGHWLTGRATYSNFAKVMELLFQSIGFTDYNVKNINQAIRGLQILNVHQPRDIIDILQRCLFFDVAERNGVLEFISRKSNSVATIRAEECIVSENGEAGYEILRAQEEDLPKSIKLTYISEADNYRQAVVEARRQSTISQYVAQAKLPIVFTQDEAIKVAETWLNETWVARERVQLRLPPTYLSLEVGDVITFITSDEQERTLRITDIRDEDFRIIESVAVDPSVYFSSVGLGKVEAVAPITSAARAQEDALVPQHQSLTITHYPPPKIAMMDLPHLLGNETLAARIAVWSNPLAPNFSVFRSFYQEHSWQKVAQVRTAPTLGILETKPKPSKEGMWDRANVMRVRMARGELTSLDKNDVLKGANYAAIEHQAGWEVIQFCSAEIIAGEDKDFTYYEVRDLIRGLAGTENEMRSPIADDALFVLLEPDKIPQIEIAPAELNQSYYYRVGPAENPYSDISYTQLEYTHRAVNQRPLSVVHLHAHRKEQGDIHIEWIRRSRELTQTGWEEMDVPLGETSEAYEVELYKGTNLVRTLNSISEHVVYSLAQQKEDFTTTTTPLRARVYQMSARFGRGAPREEIINV